MLQKKYSTPTIVAGNHLPRKQARKYGALILIAEDDDDNRLMLKTLLEMRGYRVAEAVDGEEAIRVAKELRPDLLLLDLQLPRLNGFAVARSIRHDEGLSGVPIVIVSGHDPAKHRRLALAAGCNDYLLKPVTSGHLEETIVSLLG